MRPIVAFPLVSLMKNFESSG